MQFIYSELHQNIQDKFNEGGIEINSPHYVSIRDGNRVAVPDQYIAKDYEEPAFLIRENKDSAFSGKFRRPGTREKIALLMPKALANLAARILPTRSASLRAASAAILMRCGSYALFRVSRTFSGDPVQSLLRCMKVEQHTGTPGPPSSRDPANRKACALGNRAPIGILLREAIKTADC